MERAVLTSEFRSFFPSHRLQEFMREEERARKLIEDAFGFIGRYELERLLRVEDHGRFIEAVLTQAKRLDAFPASVAHEYVDAIGSSALARFATGEGDLARQIEALSSSVLRSLEETASLASIAKLSALGQAVKSALPFGPNTTDALREALGQWTTPIDALAPPLSAIDRLECYRHQGFDADLLRLPAPHIGAVLDATELRLHALPLAACPLRPTRNRREERPLLVSPEENHKAYAILYFFERALRTHIGERMAARYGPDWERTRIRKLMRNKWERDARKAGQSATAASLEYADLSDYAEIVTDDEHWDEVFAAVFLRAESFRESIERLRPLRNATMHTRPLIAPDLIVVYAEARHVLRAIGTSLPDAELVFCDEQGVRER